MNAAAAEADWIQGGAAEGAKKWVGNVDGVVHSLRLGERQIPLVLAGDGRNASYVSSPISAWVRYPAFEASRQVPSVPPALGKLAEAPLTALLSLAGLGRTAVLGNWLVSTNLYPEASAKHWRSAREHAIEHAPDRPLIIRSICPAIHRELFESLQDDGWLMVPARLVYLCDPGHSDLWKHNHVRKDRRLLDDGAFSILGPEDISAADLPVMRRHFRQVFMEKHSSLNPDFSDDFFELCRAQRFLDLYALRHQGEIVGVLGLLERHGWLTTPLIGYDTDQPQSLALYRRLMALLLAEAARRKTRLHYSSGAGSFKRARGGTPALEYTALFVNHLSAPKRLLANLFSRMARPLAIPLLEKFG